MACKEIPENPGQYDQVNLLSCEQCTSIIIKNLRIFLKNIGKNKFLTDTLLKVNKDFDIILIQEPLWSILQTISSLSNKEGKIIVGVLNYSNLITFTRISSSKNNYLHIIFYINVWLSSLCFSFCKDILNDRDICCFSFFQQ